MLRMPALEVPPQQNQPIKTILIVEDDFSIREALREVLEAEDYHVVTAQNGQEGLLKIRDVPKPCLVLLDMIMPIMGGREFLDQVLKDSILAPIPVLFVSATATDKDIHGAAGLVKKPVDIDLLLKLVAHYAGKATIDTQDLKS